MTLISPISYPMAGRIGDAPSGASLGAGFGDLLSMLGAPLGDQGQESGIPVTPNPDRRAAALDLPATPAGEDSLRALPDASDVPVLAEASPLAAVSTTGVLTDDQIPAEADQLATPVEGEPTMAAGDDDPAVESGIANGAMPGPKRPERSPIPVPPSVAKVQDTKPSVSTKGSADASLTADLPGAPVTKKGAQPAVADSARSLPAATRPGARGAQQPKTDASVLNPSDLPVAEADPSPTEGIAAKLRAPTPDDRGKAKSNDRTTGHADPKILASADAISLPTPLTAPMAPKPADAAASPAGKDAGQPAVDSASSNAPAPAYAGNGEPQAQPGHDNLPSLLASQTPAASIARSVPPTQPYAATPNVPAQPVIAAQPGRIGRDMGVEIARQVSAGRQEVLVRLDPAEMGRIDVRLSFDDKGHLHAAMSADSPAALDMLRRDAGDLGRALANAGIQADPSTFRFDNRGGNDAGQFAQHQQNQGGQREHSQDRDGGGRRHRDDADLAALSPAYRRLRSSGRVDLTA